MRICGFEGSFVGVIFPPCESAFVRAELALTFVRSADYFRSAAQARSCVSNFNRMPSAPAFHRINGQFEFGSNDTVSLSVPAKTVDLFYL
jgi:hypothetical protein